MASEDYPANAVPFEDLCNILDQLAKKKSQKQEQRNILIKFINDFKTSVVGKQNSTFFPILRLLTPSLERERSSYNMKEYALGRLLVKVLCVNKNSADADKLMKPKTDFADSAYYVLRNRVGKDSKKLNVGEINDVLDRIASAESENKAMLLDDLFSYVMKSLTAEQIRWFLRIILKNMKKTGMSANQILSCYHPDAPELINTCVKLSKLCEDLDDSKLRPVEMGVQLFFAIRPMLSERLDVTDVECLPRAAYQLEEKFDGERFQVHMENGTFEYFSRRGHCFASTYGKTYESGLLTPLLKDCFSAHVTSFILDGEMMGWNKQRQCFGSKGMAFDVKKLKETSVHRPCFCVFDILYYNGKSLVGPKEKGGVPLNERLKLLDNMFSDVPGVIMHSRRQVVKNSSDILEALNKAIESQEEGIVVKDTESYYVANSRNGGWYKIKPEYTEGAMEDLDLVIIGADRAEDLRQGVAKSFLVAVADALDSDGAPARWVCVGRVASGLAHATRAALGAHLQAHWTARQPPPTELVFNKIKPDYWILPEHSMVLQVRASELIRSTDFGTPYTLRFPRIMALREDKPVRDAMTLEALNKLISNKGPVIKLATEGINENQIKEGSIKTRRKRPAAGPQVPTQFKRVAIDDVTVTSHALLGRKIHIASDDEDCSREELARIIKMHGGIHVAHIGADTWCSVVGRLTAHARSVISSPSDVTTTSWLRSLPPSPQPLPLTPLHMLSIKKETRLKQAKDFDAFGDSYTELLDEDTLIKLFAKMDAEPQIYLTNREMLALDKELFGDCNPYSYLRPCYMHVPNALLSLRAKMYGATLCDLTSDQLTHIVLNKDCEGIDNIKEIACDTAVVVSEEWLETCLKESRLILETKFLL